MRYDGMGPCKMADCYTSFKPRIDDSSSVD